MHMLFNHYLLWLEVKRTWLQDNINLQSIKVSVRQSSLKARKTHLNF